MLLSVQPKDYRCEDRQKFGDLRGDIGAIRQALTHYFRKPRLSTPQKKKRTVHPGDAFEEAAFKLGFEIVKF